MNAKWYRGYQVVGYKGEHIERISNLVRRHDLGASIPCLHIEKLRKGQWQFYLFLGFNTEKKGYVPAQILQILDTINIGHPVGDFDFAEIKSMTSSGIDTENYQRTLTYRPSVLSSPTLDPFDLSELEAHNTQQATLEKLTALNHLLYWMSATGAGGWQTFKNVCDLLASSALRLDPRHIFRRLRLLGHVEYADTRGSKWTICRPVLVKTNQPDCYFLAGQRTPKLIASLAKFTDLENEHQPTGEGPDVTQLRLTSAKPIQQAVNSGKINVGLAGVASMKLARILPTLGDFRTNLSPVSGFVTSNFSFEQWQDHIYVETYFENQTGLYRLTPHDDNPRLSSHSLFYDAVTGQWRSGPWYDLCYLAQQDAGEQCIAHYHPGQQRLAVPANFRWPDLYERSLVLSSGQLPLRSSDNNWFYFSDISPELAQLLANKLNATIEEATPCTT